MFRLIIGILAVIGLASLFFGANAAAGAGLLLLAPILILLKVLFFIALVGFVMAGLGRRGHWRQRSWDPADWRRGFSGGAERESDRRARARRGQDDAERERFQAWHDLEHARREVDSWTEDQF